jgi:hypothetical protein
MITRRTCPATSEIQVLIAEDLDLIRSAHVALIALRRREVAAPLIGVFAADLDQFAPVVAQVRLRRWEQARCLVNLLCRCMACSAAAATPGRWSPCCGGRAARTSGR